MSRAGVLSILTALATAAGASAQEAFSYMYRYHNVHVVANDDDAVVYTDSDAPDPTAKGSSVVSVTDVVNGGVANLASVETYGLPYGPAGIRSYASSTGAFPPGSAPLLAQGWLDVSEDYLVTSDTLASGTEVPMTLSFHVSGLARMGLANGATGTDLETSDGYAYLSHSIYAGSSADYAEFFGDFEIDPEFGGFGFFGADDGYSDRLDITSNGDGLYEADIDTVIEIQLTGVVGELFYFESFFETSVLADSALAMEADFNFLNTTSLSIAVDPAFNANVVAAAPVPEPTSFALMATGGLLALRRRR